MLGGHVAQPLEPLVPELVRNMRQPVRIPALPVPVPGDLEDGAGQEIIPHERNVRHRELSPEPDIARTPRGRPRSGQRGRPRGGQRGRPRGGRRGRPRGQKGQQRNRPLEPVIDAGEDDDDFNLQIFQQRVVEPAQPNEQQPVEAIGPVNQVIVFNEDEFPIEIDDPGDGLVYIVVDNNENVPAVPPIAQIPLNPPIEEAPNNPQIDHIPNNAPNQNVPPRVIEWPICSICLETRVNRALLCGHLFCGECVVGVQRENRPRCPTCRDPIDLVINVYA